MPAPSLTPHQWQALAWLRDRPPGQFIHQWVGSFRSGKTWGSAVMALAHMNGRNDGFAIVGTSVGAVRRNCLPPLRYAAELLGVSYDEVLSKGLVRVADSDWHVFGASDSSSQRTIRGMSLAGAWLDELSEMGEDYFQMTAGRLDRPRPLLACTQNAAGPMHWTKALADRVAADGTGVVRNTLLTDNTTLPPDAVALLSATQRGHYYRRYVLNEWVSPSGLVYPDYTLADSDGALTDVRYWLCDYGAANPTAIIELAQRADGGWLARNEYYRAAPITLAQHIAGAAAALQTPAGIVIDPSAAAFRLELQAAGYKVELADNDIRRGVQSLGAALASGTITIHRRCENLRRELASLVWQITPSGEERPVKANDHACDALRYGALRFTPLGGGAQVLGSADAVLNAIGVKL